MKKMLVSVFALTALVGCGGYFDYYKGGVRYTQDGDDCIYYAGEYGRKFSNDIAGMDMTKKIVYRNTRCADLMSRDTAAQDVRQERQVLTPAARQVTTESCGCNNSCNTCGRRYVIVK